MSNMANLQRSFRKQCTIVNANRGLIDICFANWTSRAPASVFGMPWSVQWLHLLPLLQPGHVFESCGDSCSSLGILMHRCLSNVPVPAGATTCHLPTCCICSHPLSTAGIAVNTHKWQACKDTNTRTCLHPLQLTATTSRMGNTVLLIPRS